MRRLVLLLLCAGACADSESGSYQPPPAPQLEVHNLTLFDLEELRLHSTPVYREAPNRLAGRLRPERSTTLQLEPHEATTYVTVIREKVRDGEKIALTTAYPLELYGAYYALDVLETSFRLRRLGELPPPRRDAGPPAARDAGPPDAGPPDAPPKPDGPEPPVGPLPDRGR